MSFKIGRVEFDWGHSAGGAQLGAGVRTYSVEVNPGTVEKATAMSLQLRGQVGKLVAVTWDDDPEVDGLYIVEDCSVSPIQNYLATGRMQANVALRAQRGVVEAAYSFTYRDTDPVNYFPIAVHGFYDDAANESWAMDNGLAYLNHELSIAGPDDAPAVIRYGDLASAALTTVQAQQGVDPKLFYVGAARIEVMGADGSDWWTLTGDRVPEGHDLRISSGAVRCRPVHGEDYVVVDMWDSTLDEWVPAARYSFGLDAPTGGFIRRWEVLRNDNAEVSVRGYLVRYDQRAATVTLTLQRGIITVGAAISSGFEGFATAPTVVMSEADGTGMATEVISGRLRRTADISGTAVRPHLEGDSATVTYSTVTDDAKYASVSLGWFGLGTNSVSWRANTSVADTVV